MISVGETPSETTEERIVRLSVLQELTVAALDLFDPSWPTDPFLERMAERLGCLAAMWLTVSPHGAVELLGAAGISEASRALPIAALAPGEARMEALTVPYTELSRCENVRWSFCLQESTESQRSPIHALLLWFDAAHVPSAQYLGAVERLVGVLRTVLMHRRLAEDLGRSYAQLARTQLALIERERLAATGELAAVVAHEVRNPLAVIFNCVSTLQKSAPASDETASLLAILAEEAERLNQIVSELLDFARPGAVTLRPESLEEILAGAIAAVKSGQPGAAEIEFELLVAPSLPRLSLDERLIRRAAINLIGNAVQAMPGGGRVEVRLTADTLDARPAIRMEVSDEGPGMSASVLARIFDPFFTTRASGTGLGLSIVRRVVDAHQGNLTVHSTEGKGTTFVVRLPAQPA